MKKCRFKKHESGYHKHAVQELASWVDGRTEVEFKVDDKLVFVADVVSFDEDEIIHIYEVVHSHPVDGRKLGMIQYYCHANSTELVVYEVSADFILKQTEKPDQIELMECYIIDDCIRKQ